MIKCLGYVQFDHESFIKYPVMSALSGISNSFRVMTLEMGAPNDSTAVLDLRQHIPGTKDPARPGAERPGTARHGPARSGQAASTTSAFGGATIFATFPNCDIFESMVVSWTVPFCSIL